MAATDIARRIATDRDANASEFMAALKQRLRV
jgi:hypothetical protein